MLLSLPFPLPSAKAFHKVGLQRALATTRPSLQPYFASKSALTAAVHWDPPS
jgi:hypothetical protein